MAEVGEIKFEISTNVDDVTAMDAAKRNAVDAVYHARDSGGNMHDAGNLAGAAAVEAYLAHQYSYLCCECGGVAPVSTWTFLQRDIDTDELRPSRWGESDPICVCPCCGWHHVDNDSGAGIYDGTRVVCDEWRQKLASADEGRDWSFTDAVGFWADTWGVEEMAAR